MTRLYSFFPLQAQDILYKGVEPKLILNACTFQGDSGCLDGVCILQIRLQSTPREEGRRNACQHAGFPPRSPTTAGAAASALRRPPNLPLGTRGLELVRHRPLPIGEGKGHPVPSAPSRQLFCKRGSKYKYCQGKGARGPWSMVTIRLRPRVHQPYKMVGSPDRRDRPPLARPLSPASPTGLRSPGRSGCTCVRCSPPPLPCRK